VVDEASGGRERPKEPDQDFAVQPPETETGPEIRQEPIEPIRPRRRRSPRRPSLMEPIIELEAARGFEPPPSVEDAFRGVAAAAEAAGIDLKKLSFDELMRLYETTREYEARMQREHREYEQAGQEYDLQRTINLRELDDKKAIADREAKFRTVEATVRSVLAGILLIGSVGGVFYGVASGTPAQELTQYLAPITGLAGIAIGYFFGRQSQQ